MKRVLYMLFVAVMLLAMAFPVMAQDKTTVDTVAVIDGAGLVPFVKAKWEVGPRGDDDPTRPGVQVIPNLSSIVNGQVATGETTICVYAVVTDPNGPNDISDVFFDVYEPAAHCAAPTVFKVQVHMTNLFCGPTAQDLVRNAYNAGIMTLNTGVTLEDLLWELDCAKGGAHLWYGCFTYHTCLQPDGTYGIYVRAVDSDGGVGELYNADLEIASVVALKADFATVNYGAIKPSVRKMIGGDENFGTADRPTLVNLGNDPAQLYVTSSALTGDTYGKLITDFDIEFRGQYLTYVAGQRVNLDGVYGPLVRCTPTQIDFSILAPYGIPQDTYRGTILIEIDHADGYGMYCN